VPARVGDDDAAVAAKGFALGTPHLERSEVVVQEQNGLSLSLLLVIEPDIVERSERHRLHILLTGSLRTSGFGSGCAGETVLIL
jgi:hypothetical protein